MSGGAGIAPATAPASESGAKLAAMDGRQRGQPTRSPLVIGGLRPVWVSNHGDDLTDHSPRTGS